jgi:hypothetical protein
MESMTSSLGAVSEFSCGPRATSGTATSMIHGGAQ